MNASLAYCVIKGVWTTRLHCGEQRLTKTRLHMEQLAVGDLQLLRERYDGAESAYREAIKQAPDRPAGYLRLASLLRRQGEQEAAESVLSKALEVSPTDREGLLMLASLRENRSAGVRLLISIAVW